MCLSRPSVWACSDDPAAKTRLLAAGRRVADGADRRKAVLGHVRGHELLVAELVAHGARGLLLVGRAHVAGGRIEVADRRPAAGARLVLADGLL